MLKGSFSRLYWWYEDEVIMIVPARSPSEPEPWSEYSNKGVIAARAGRPLVCVDPSPLAPCIIPPAAQSFLFCLRFILPVMSCPNEMLIFTEISFLLMFAVTTYLFPSCLEISALWMSGLSSTIFFLSMCENTMNAFIGRFMWFGECFFVWN